MMSIDERAEQKVNDYLEHYGVKGMKWGVHKKLEVPETTISSTSSLVSDIEKSDFKSIKEEELKSILKTIRSKDSGVPNFIADQLENYAKDGYYIVELAGQYIKLQNESGDTKTTTISYSDKLKDFYDSAQKGLIKGDKSKVSEVKKKPDISSRIPDFTGDSVVDKIKKIYNLPIAYWPAAIKSAFSHSDMDELEDYLMHHGIEGQKWGVRHGPPYPLDRKTSSEIKKGKEVTESKSSDDKKEYEDEFTKDFDEVVELIKSKNPDKSIDDIIFEKSLEELSDSMSYWWEGKPAINDFKQWDNFMSDKTYKDMEALHNKFNNVEVEYDHGPSAEISMNGNKKTITFWPKEDWNFIVEKKMTKDDEKVLRDVINKYPYKKYEYSNPKFDSDNKLTGFESREEYTKRKEKERKLSDRKRLFSKEYWESRYASYLDRKEKKLQHSSLEYVIVDDVLEHHGIEGQKWGIKHGPPYPLDRKTSKAIKKSGKVTVNVKDLSDDDLRRIISRLQMEKQLKELTKEDTKKAETYVSKSLKNLRDKMTNTVFDIMSDSLKTVSKYALNKKLTAEVKKEKDS